MNDDHAAQTGTQSLDRAMRLLHLIADADAPCGTGELARRAGLTRPTAHRLLQGLHHAGMVSRADVPEPVTRSHRTARWELGPQLAVLGTLAAARRPLPRLARPLLQRIAQATGESAFLSVLRGHTTVCVAEEEGWYPMRSYVLHVGSRFPVGVGTAGMAFAGLLDADELDRALAATRAGRVELGPAFDDDRVRVRAERTRRLGWAWNPGLIVAGSHGVGVAVREPGAPAWALSVTGVEQRFADGRAERLAETLLEAAAELRERLAH